MKIAKKTYIIFCDDVREELGNKLSLMGVYSGQIILPMVPQFLRTFCIVVFFEELKKNFKKFKIVFTLPGAKPIEVSGTPTFPKAHKKNMNIVFGLTHLKIENAGMASAKLFVDDAKRPEIECGIEVVVGQTPIGK